MLLKKFKQKLKSLLKPAHRRPEAHRSDSALKASRRVGQKIAAKKAVARAAAATLTAFTLLSCGQGPASNPLTTPPTTSAFQQGSQNQTFTTNFNTLSPQKAAALMGTYDLTLVKQTYDYYTGGMTSAPLTATMTLQNLTSTGASWGALLFHVNASQYNGAIDFQSYVGVDASNVYNYVFFATPTISQPDFIQTNFALLIGLRLTSAGQVDPTQSMVYVMDCGFSQTGVCMNPVSGLNVQAILRKR